MAGRSSWLKLPIELQYKIYRSPWKSSTVFLGIPELPEEFYCRVNYPATLHLSRAARAETLRYYTKIHFSFQVPGKQETIINRYINPELDVLFLDNLFRTNRLTLSIEPSMTLSLHSCSLHIAIGQNINPSTAIKLFTESGTMAYVGTFDFWFISDGDGDEDEETPSRTPAQWSMLPIISRYRLCRTANTTKTRLVTFENTLWCPQQEHGNYQCSEPDCPNPTSDWRWKHV